MKINDLFILGRYTIKRGTSSREAAGLASGNRQLRFEQLLRWKAMSVIKAIGGKQYAKGSEYASEPRFQIFGHTLAGGIAQLSAMFVKAGRVLSHILSGYNSIPRPCERVVEYSRMGVGSRPVVNWRAHEVMDLRAMRVDKPIVSKFVGTHRTWGCAVAPRIVIPRCLVASTHQKFALSVK